MRQKEKATIGAFSDPAELLLQRQAIHVILEKFPKKEKPLFSKIQ